MKQITHYDLMYDFLFTLNGDAYLTPLHVKDGKKENVTQFLIGHYNKERKISDFTKIRDFVNNLFDDSATVTMVTVKEEFFTGPALIDKKAMFITFN